MKLKNRLLAICLAAILIAGCAKFEQKELQDATLKLKWLHQSQFAGNYVAKEKGFYAGEGINVKIEPFSFDFPTIDAVAGGKADFGITGADELVLARAKGMPLKAIAVIYKINPVTAYALKSSGIEKPQDFVGKKVGLERGTNVDTLYYVMMNRLGVDRSRIKEISIGYDATELLNGSVDVSTGYIINEPNQAVEAGHEVNTILMADYGANMYADVLFATEDTINNKPELVEKFVKATLQGWQYAIENENEAADLTLKYTAGGKRAHELYMLKSSVPLINTGKSPLGWMEKGEWERVVGVLAEQKLLDRKIAVEEAYTMQFLERIYRQE